MEYVFGFAAPVVALLLNSLWEDALIALGTFGILRALPQLNASTRYAIWWASLVAAFAVPLLSMIPFVVHQHPTTVAPSQIAARPIEQLASGSEDWSGRPWSTASTNSTASTGTTPIPTSAAVPTIHRLNLSLPRIAGLTAFAIWAAVAAAIVTRLALALMQLERLKRDAMPLPVEYREKMGRWLEAIKGSRDIRLCVSDATDVPIAVGLFDAMILIPRHLLDLLTQDEVDQISLHELAHLRRSDDWTNAIQRLIQAMLFFNPAVQLIGQQLDLEREVACDDWVLAQTNAVRPYALCLTKMAENAAWPHRAVPAPGVFVTRKAISLRIERLLRAGRNVRTSVCFGAASGAAIAIVAIAFIVTSVAPSIAFTQTQAQIADTHDTRGQSQKHAADSASKTNAVKGSHAAKTTGSKPATEAPPIELNPVHNAVAAADRENGDGSKTPT